MSRSDWHQEETYKSLMLYGSSAVKYVLLVNGGSVIALLTFLGNLLNSPGPAPDMRWPLGCFLLGIVFGGIAHLTAYLTQLSLYNEGNGYTPVKSHMFWLWWTILLVAAGVAVFGVGSFLALLELGQNT